MRICLFVFLCLMVLVPLAKGAAFYVNGLPADDLLSYRDYLDSKLERVSEEEGVLSLYAPVKELAFLTFSEDDKMVWQDVYENDLLVLTDIPMVYLNRPLMKGDLKANMIGLLWEGQDGRPAFLYLYPRIIWAEVKALDCTSSWAYLSFFDDGPIADGWYEKKFAQWPTSLAVGDVIYVYQEELIRYLEEKICFLEY